MADEATDVQDGQIDLANFEGEEAKPSVESSSAEEKKPEVVENPAETAKAEEAEANTDEVQPSAKPEEEAEQPQGKAEERKASLNTEIRDLVAQRNALKEEVAKANSEVYQPATESELEAEGLSATDAKVEALRQQIEVKDYNDKVADAQLTIESESQRVLRDFPAFDPESKEFDNDLAAEAAQLLQANLILDPNTGQVIGSNVSPYQLYKTLAKASGISGQKGQLKGQQDTERMLANADVGSAAAPAKKAVDPLMALFEDPNS